ncbi:MAG: hypothetical protein Kow0026_12330 [Oricola sp.]
MTTQQDSWQLDPKKQEPEPKAITGGTSIYESARLFRGSTEIGIEHDGAIYRLKITRQGKLILNK